MGNEFLKARIKIGCFKWRLLNAQPLLLDHQPDDGVDTALDRFDLGRLIKCRQHGEAVSLKGVQLGVCERRVHAEKSGQAWSRSLRMGSATGHSRSNTGSFQCTPVDASATYGTVI